MRPNILWICTDQQRYDTLGCYGNNSVTTRNIDRLAREGTRFEYAFSQSPVCTPSRGAFLTGRYPRTCRIRQNGAAVPGTEVLVTRMLADAGYHCGLSGKLHLSPCHPEYLGAGGREARIDDGYETFHWSHGSGSMKPAQNDYHRWLDEQGLAWESRPFEDYPRIRTAMTRDTSQTAWCTDKAIEFINKHVDEPWLFSVNIFDPHAGFDPPMEYLSPYLERLDDIPLPSYVEGELHGKPKWQMYDHLNGAYGGGAPNLAYARLSASDHRHIRAAYWAMCDQIDYHVGRMIRFLEESGQRENTIIIFTSDHGELIGDHGIYFKGPFFYDCSIRVPLIVSMPDTVRPQTSSASGELYDLKSDPGEHRNLWNVPGANEIKTEMLIRLADRLAFTLDPLPERVATW